LPRAHLDFGSRSPTVFTLSHLYLVGGSFTVTATVTDDDTGVGVATASIVVSSLNTPPSGLVVAAGLAAEGGTATLTVTFVDPDAADTHTVSLDWGDGTLQSLALPAGVTSLSPTHVYQDSGTYNPTVTVADSAASTPPVTAAVNVANVAPTVTALNLSASSILEQESVTAEATFADPGVSDTFTLTMDWGDGTSSSADLAAGARAGSASHQYLRAGQFVITATVLDRDNAMGSMAKMLDVRARNHAPTGLTVAASSPVEGSPATLSGSFTDLDAADAHTVSITWGDGSTGTLPLGAGAATFSATHTYATHGTYHSNVTVTDPAGLAASAAVDVVVQAKTQGGGSTECDLLLALKQRLSQSPWSDHPALRALLERAIAILMAHFGCDDEDGDDGDRSGEHHGDITHAAKTPARDAATKPKPNVEHSGRTGR
jgi:PKD repeat protein